MLKKNVPVFENIVRNSVADNLVLFCIPVSILLPNYLMKMCTKLTYLKLSLCLSNGVPKILGAMGKRYKHCPPITLVTSVLARCAEKK